MKAHIKWQLMRLFQQIWVRVTLFSLLGVVTAFCGLWFNKYVPKDWVEAIGADSVDDILTILASSMLAVTTFSLNTMLGAYNSVSTNVTPRATQLLIQDQTTQNVLSSFVGAFVFSIVGLISLQAGVYGSRGKVVIFFVTLCVVAAVVFTLLRWINHLMKFGRFGEATQRVEDATADALAQQVNQNQTIAHLPVYWQAPEQAQPVYSNKTGYIQYIDTQALNDLCTNENQHIYCIVQAGCFVTTATLIAYSVGLAPACDSDIADAFALEADRSFEQDPRFGFCVLAEVASKALSSAINDAGTAINVVSRGTRLLINYDEQRRQQQSKTGAKKETENEYLNTVFLMPLTDQELFDDFFTPIARDGAGIIEVVMALLVALEQLNKVNPIVYGPLVKQHVNHIVERAQAQMGLLYDRERVHAKAQEILQDPSTKD